MEIRVRHIQEYKALLEKKTTFPIAPLFDQIFINIIIIIFIFSKGSY